MNTVEFRDVGGGYVLALPVDDVRCRVLASNVVGKDRVLFKDPDLSWEEASEDLGGFTRLDPSDFAAPEQDPEESSLLADLEAAVSGSARTTDDRISGLEGVPDPASLSSLADADDAPRSQVARLVAHYLAAHGGRSRTTLPHDVCRCAGFRLGDSRREARLHAMVAVSTAAKALPDVRRLVGAYRKRSRKPLKAA